MVSSIVKIDAEYFWRQVEAILIEDGFSLNELAKISGLEYKGLAKLRDGITRGVQHSTMRKIAEATNRDFHINGDRVTFTKKAESGKGMPEDLQELLRMYDKMDPDGRRQLLKIARALWSEDGVLTETESKKGSN